MNFSRTTKYALKVLSYMARQHQEMHTAKSLHQQLDIPAQYLRQLMTTLSKNGFIASTRGRGGGFMFARDIRSISVGEIVEAVEGLSGFGVCILGFTECPLETKCPMHDKWQEIRHDIMRTLNATSLHSLALGRE